MKFSIKYFFSKCDQICRKPRIWSHLLKRSLMENIIFCAVNLIQIIWQNVRKSNKIGQDQKTSTISHPEVFLGKGVLNICWKFTGEHYPEVWFQYSCKAFLMKSHFGMAVLLWICCIFSARLFRRTPLDGCFWNFTICFCVNFDN